MPQLPPVNKALMAAQRTSGSGEQTVHEIFTLINNAKNKEDKLRILKKNDTAAMRQLLKAAFDPAIAFDMPPGNPPFMRNEAPEGTEHTSLFYASKKLWHFVKGADPVTNSLQKEKMFLGLLESLHNKDADVLLGIKNKDLNKTYKGLTENLVKEAFNWSDNFVKNN